VDSPAITDALDTGKLCLSCGLCCNGTIFANVKLQPGDDAARLRDLGLRISIPRSASPTAQFTQPCAALEGCRCRIYDQRPRYCREFECVLLKSVKAGELKPAAALRIIGVAKQRSDKVRELLRDLGETDEQATLAARFRRTAKRLQQADLDQEKAGKYGQLTLAVHELNYLLSENFYPGTGPVKAA
jgi:Fe-S-cluster containining protein